MAYSIEIRQKAMDYWDRCKDINQVIQAYGISRSSLFSWKRLKQQTGELSPKPHCTEPRKINRDKLKSYIDQNPDAYLAEIAQHFNCTAPAIFYALKAMNITHKKRPLLTKNKTPLR